MSPRWSNVVGMSEPDRSKAQVRLAAITFDCADPVEMGRFYTAVLDLPVLWTSDNTVAVGHEGRPPFLAFTRVENYHPPTWPDDELPKQAHLELGVDDLDAAQAAIIALGARETPLQAGADRFRVLLDPAGHPFCINIAF
jgi:catechol 2,3-dioxygenase-like lactoylglutathione lyase family enzyme